MVVRARKGAPEDVNAFAQSCLVQPSASVGGFAVGVNVQHIKGLVNGPCKNTQNLKKNYVARRNLGVSNETSRSLFFLFVTVLELQ